MQLNLNFKSICFCICYCWCTVVWGGKCAAIKWMVFDIMQHDNAVSISINVFVLGGEFFTWKAKVYSWMFLILNSNNCSEPTEKTWIVNLSLFFKCVHYFHLFPGLQNCGHYHILIGAPVCSCYDWAEGLQDYMLDFPWKPLFPVNIVAIWKDYFLMSLSIFPAIFDLIAAPGSHLRVTTVSSSPCKGNTHCAPSITDRVPREVGDRPDTGRKRLILSTDRL